MSFAVGQVVSVFKWVNSAPYIFWSVEVTESLPNRLKGKVLAHPCNPKNADATIKVGGVIECHPSSVSSVK